MASVAADGFANPLNTDGHFYPAFGNRVPALRSFYLRYDKQEDHEIQHMQVMVGGPSKDLSPTADLQPNTLPDGRLDVLLRDDDPTEWTPTLSDPTKQTPEKFYYKVSHSLLATPRARRFQFRDLGCVGECVQKLPLPSLGPGPVNLEPSIHALVGFELQFTGNREHKLDRVGVWFRDNDLHVTIRDKDGGDTFGYLVDFVMIPTTGLNVSTGIQRGRARGGQKFSIPSPSGTDFLLTGWCFNFVSDDHHIRDLGVVRNGDDVTVFYGDENADDPFDWRVEWANVGRLGLAPA